MVPGRRDADTGLVVVYDEHSISTSVRNRHFGGRALQEGRDQVDE